MQVICPSIYFFKPKMQNPLKMSKKCADTQDDYTRDNNNNHKIIAKVSIENLMCLECNYFFLKVIALLSKPVK